MLLSESELRELIRESYLQILSEGRDFDREIVSLILAIKDVLTKRNFICQAQYSSPDPNKRHRDFGFCSIRVDTTAGRGKSMSQRAISRMVARIANGLGAQKYFSNPESGFDGKYCDCGMKLKPKYVSKYMAAKQMAI